MPTSLNRISILFVRRRWFWRRVSYSLFPCSRAFCCVAPLCLPSRPHRHPSAPSTIIVMPTLASTLPYMAWWKMAPPARSCFSKGEVSKGAEDCRARRRNGGNHGDHLSLIRIRSPFHARIAANSWRLLREPSCTPSRGEKSRSRCIWYTWCDASCYRAQPHGLLDGENLSRNAHNHTSASPLSITGEDSGISPTRNLIWGLDIVNSFLLCYSGDRPVSANNHSSFSYNPFHVCGSTGLGKAPVATRSSIPRVQAVLRIAAPLYQCCTPRTCCKDSFSRRSVNNTEIMPPEPRRKGRFERLVMKHVQ